MRCDMRGLAGGLSLALLVTGGTTSPAGAGTLQDPETLRALAAAYLHDAARAAHPGLEVQVRIGRIDPRLRLSHCPVPEFQLTAGSRLYGNGSLGVRCRDPLPWTLYVGYGIALSGEVLVARRPLPAGTALLAEDLEMRRMPLEQAPGNYFRAVEQLRGALTARALGAGQPVTVDSLKRRFVIRANQRVRLLVEGAGFQVSQEGTAQNAAYMGETVGVKMPSGRIIQGVAEADGSVRLP